jgi:hypothetical protein
LLTPPLTPSSQLSRSPTTVSTPRPEAKALSKCLRTPGPQLRRHRNTAPPQTSLVGRPEVASTFPRPLTPTMDR